MDIAPSGLAVIQELEPGATGLADDEAAGQESKENVEPDAGTLTTSAIADRVMSPSQLAECRRLSSDTFAGVLN